uniref:Peptidase M48 domain-containing protein n=1 Tax=Kalanchoe fedtschenkoi TaxID=63787 RepID=A0A7N0ZSK5_KALFE
MKQTCMRRLMVALRSSIVDVVVLLLLSSALYSCVETVPYTGRKHLVFLSLRSEMRIWRDVLVNSDYEKSTLPDAHPDTVRVRLIGERIIRGLEKSSSLPPVPGLEEEGLNWEFFVLDDPYITAKSFMGGKIMLNTGLLRAEPADDDNLLALVLAHEVAHIVARHQMERFSLEVITLSWILGSYGERLVSRIYNSKRMEYEADHIGLLLMASAGYDPQRGVNSDEKLFQWLHKWLELDLKVVGTNGTVICFEDLYGYDQQYSTTHPHPLCRIQYLRQDNIMNKAVDMYHEALIAPPPPSADHHRR